MAVSRGLALLLLTVVVQTEAFRLPRSSPRGYGILQAARQQKDNGKVDPRLDPEFRKKLGKVTKKTGKGERGAYSKGRMNKLGTEGTEEYDLDLALAANTDDGITKIIAGSLIATLLVLIYFGLLAPQLFEPECINIDGEKVSCVKR